MASPTLDQIHIDRGLTFVSNFYAQTEDKFIATKVFPMVPSPVKSDKIWTINKGDFARNTMQLRAPGAESVGISYNVDADNSYDCKVRSVHSDIPDQLLRNAD